jgi:hypothetical protein
LKRRKEDLVLQGWDNFYFMIGSAGAGLFGLLFVVVTLTAGTDPARVTRGQALYMTPTAMHFTVVLTISAVAVAPGVPISAMALIFGLIALAGLANSVRSCLGIADLQRGDDPPHWSDFWMYGATPTLAYLGLGAAATALGAGLAEAAYALAAMLLVLLLIGIRNAWDLVTWMAPRRPGAGS